MIRKKSSLSSHLIVYLTLISISFTSITTNNFTVGSFFEKNDNTSFNFDEFFTYDVFMKSRIVNQDHVADSIYRALNIYRLGLKDGKRPIGVYLFLGSTGVGKTEFVKVLGELLLGNAESIVRLDMSQYAYHQDVAHLVGANPGTVGFGEDSHLIKQIRGKKNCIILLDEFEKADPQVQKFFLGVFEEGYFRSSCGETFHLDESLFFLTSNISADSILDYQRQSMSRKNVLKLIEPDVKKRISPELYNRTQPIVFNTLNKHDIKEIGRNNIDLYVEKIEAIKDISIYLDDSFFELFMDEFVVSTDLGARPFMRNMNEHIIYKISEMITTYNLPAHTKLMLAYRGSDIVVDVVEFGNGK